MTAGDIYTVAGSATGASGNAGDGGPATSALMASTPEHLARPRRRPVHHRQRQRHHPRGRLRHPRRDPARSRPDQFPGPGPVRERTRRPDRHPARRRPGHLLGPVRRLLRRPITWPPARYCILPQDQGATLTYQLRHRGLHLHARARRTSYTYNAAGQLTAETDTAGDTLTSLYSSPAPAELTGNCPVRGRGTCKTITSASGRALVLGYSGTADSGQVTSVTDPMGRTWTYGYTGAELPRPPTR